MCVHCLLRSLGEHGRVLVSLLDSQLRGWWFEISTPHVSMNPWWNVGWMDSACAIAN